MIKNPYNKIYRLTDLRIILQKLSDLIDSMGFDPDDFSLPFDRSTIYQQIFLLKSYETNDIGSMFIVSHPAFEDAIEGYSDLETIVEYHNNLTFDVGNAEHGEVSKGIYDVRQHKDIERKLIRANVGSQLGLILDLSAIILAIVIKDILKTQIKQITSNKEKIDFLYDYEAELRHKKKSMHKNLNKSLTEYVEIEIEKHLKKENLVQNPSLVEINKIVQNLNQEFESNAICQSLINSLKIEDFEQVRVDLYELLKRPSYWDFSKKEPEKYYHIFMFGLLQFLDFRYDVKSNKESGYGRYDIMLIPINRQECGVIFEIKKSEVLESKFDEVEFSKALEQIDTNEYYTELKSKGIKKVLNIAVIFNEAKPNISFTTKEIT